MRIEDDRSVPKYDLWVSHAQLDHGWPLIELEGYTGFWHKIPSMVSDRLAPKVGLNERVIISASTGNIRTVPAESKCRIVNAHIVVED